MPTAQYRPLDTGHGRPAQSSVLRGAHGGKLRALCPKTANSRRIFVCVLLLMMLLVYVVWCAVANYTDDGRADTYTTSDLFDSKQTTELPSISCTESFVDTRLYIQDKSRQEWNNLSMIYFVTPTYPRREQVPELTRLAYTLLHVPRIHWIVANDYNACNPYLDILLNKFGIPFTHLSSPMPERFHNSKSKPRGVSNRRAAMQWLRQRNITSGVLYFGDDDNTYDLKLFSEIRETKIVSMFPVGLIASYGISGPVVRKGKVVGFLDSWVAGRRWPVDMAGFAVSLAYMAEYPNASMPFKPGYEEDYFLRSVALTLDKIEPKGNNCTEILVWHTQTKNHPREAVKISQEYLDNRSNLGALFKALNEMGVSEACEEEGNKAIISSNGKAKALSYYLS
ncbi:Galactosylgalactosylxylosylprotein 3-beta-glucuronosyltransferase S [Lucilia cuprina]|uniref:Galactosylgalactosylxylosylprotein 3-beta-glucuronosyltransferase n=1 Tax=Lucilia cuprina TaxID=7375 RepID=A0A0L0BL08_LUCCU|nr:Galactosylgalactosylxylosylprotein 3-beta-glucuronosyltransferase S [Lucilia cuprina]KNC20732.1 Galactosylgalactosylxylosylprotein 3-beta-glucuronosyltransferase S [Lucilia cuprina]